MLASIRSALLMIAALTATTIAPAKAGPAGEPLLPATSATLPKVDVPKLLDPQGEPSLAQPQADASTPPSADDEETQPAVRPTGDLPTMVAQLRGADAGTHELDCLATGVYF
jgi:N-acetylmuramoyl-L-alanine amidase